VIGFGGYPALPALLAASSARIPSLIHEQNAVLGRVNRYLAKSVDAIATAYHEDRPARRRAMPARSTWSAIRCARKCCACAGSRSRIFRGQPVSRAGDGRFAGRSVLAKWCPMGWPCCRHPAHRLQVIQQCRPEDLDAVRARYAAHDIPAELGTYFEDMASRLADAHLFVGRPGASTIAELTAVGRPAILVPLPIATDDHQAANTREMVKAAARGRSVRPVYPTELAKQIQAMAMNPATLANAAHAAWNCGHPMRPKIWPIWSKALAVRR
jgi:UDP-N-acetylglucosamine--N-acetylmuramyl-(pentapeptide) pyrophosphoryl-undecaprenol N-acetylglucosamine transferase